MSDDPELQWFRGIPASNVVREPRKVELCCRLSARFLPGSLGIASAMEPTQPQRGNSCRFAVYEAVGDNACCLRDFIWPARAVFRIPRWCGLSLMTIDHY
jgi:hypothetical protein